MFEKDKCYNGGNKHNFQPRYTEMATGISPTKISGMTTTEEVKSLRSLCINNVYIGDICVWCGKVVKVNDKGTMIKVDDKNP